MCSVQASGCAPIVRAFETGADHAVEFPNAQTRASGLRVPKAIGDFLMLRILRESGGGAIAIDDDEMIRVTREVGAAEGLFVAPEGAAVSPRCVLSSIPARSNLTSKLSCSTPARASNISSAISDVGSLRHVEPLSGYVVTWSPPANAGGEEPTLNLRLLT